MEFSKIREITAEVLDTDPAEITMKTSFIDDLGADSLSIYQIITAIEDEFDLEIPSEAAEKIVTVEDAVYALKAAQK